MLVLLSSSSCTQKEKPLTHQQSGNEIMSLVIHVAWEMPSYKVLSTRCSLPLPEKILPVQLDMASMLAWRCCCQGGSACRRPCKARMSSLCWGICWDTVAIAQWTSLISPYSPRMYSYKLSRAGKCFSQPEQLQIRVYSMSVVGCPLPMAVFGWSLTHMGTTSCPQQPAE